LWDNISYMVVSDIVFDDKRIGELLATVLHFGVKPMTHERIDRDL
jgi:hypothetical protein